jgi:hypothetical protein
MTHPGGRPNDYTPELAKEICEEIENTPRGLEYICQQNPHFPVGRTVRRWLKQIPEFRPLYAQSKEIQADRMADEAIEIAYDDRKDWKVILDSEGNEKTVFVSEAVNRSRLKIDTIKWKTEVMAPKKYSQKKITEGVLDILVTESTRKVRDAENKY